MTTTEIPPHTAEVTFGLADAATACGVHADTIRRALRRNLIPGATRATGPNGAWVIPASGLRAAGFDPTTGPPPPPSLAAALRQVADGLALLAEAVEVQP